MSETRTTRSRPSSPKRHQPQRRHQSRAGRTGAGRQRRTSNGRPPAARRQSPRHASNQRRNQGGAKTAGAATRAVTGAGTAPFLILVSIVVFLSLLGLTMVLSASSVDALANTGSPWGEFTSQLVWLVLGSFAMAVMTLIDHRRLRMFTLLALGASVLLLVGVLLPFLGVEVNGAQRWIQLGSLRFQPSEIAKLTLVLYASHVLARTREVDMRRSVPPIVTVLILFGALILAQPNLGTTIIIFAIGLAILFASGVRLVALAGLGVLSVAAAAALAWFAPYRRARLLAFQDPWSDPLGDTWQTINSLVSVANGGVTGVGIGSSRGKFGFLPEAHNDFLFAVTAEEFGLVGASVVVLAYAFFGFAALVVARRADRFGSLLVVGITTWVLIQAFINIGGVLGVLPITGVPLPFMSAGGTSLVSTMAAVGILLNVARSVR